MKKSQKVRNKNARNIKNNIKLGNTCNSNTELQVLFVKNYKKTRNQIKQ